MHRQSRLRSRSSSIGLAWTRLLLLVIVAIILYFAARKIFPTREERLWKFVESSRGALMDGREDDFFAVIDPTIHYQKSGGIDGLRRDWKAYRSNEMPPVSVTKHEAAFDDEGADVRLDAVFAAGLTIHVKLRAVDRDGPWRVTSIAWE